MVFCRSKGRLFAGMALVGFMLAVAGCQSSDGGGGLLGVGGDDSKQAAKPEAGKVTASSLRAYCPKVSLRAGTAYFNTYGKGGKRADGADSASGGDQQNDSSNIVYQASITDVTRDCTHADGTMTINVAVAGKVVPGPLGKPGDVTMPIRIVVMSGTEVIYSKLHQYKVQISGTSAATQFVFSDPAVVVPEPAAANYRVFAGYDEGPPAKPQKKRVKRKKAPVAAAAPAPKQPGSQTSISDIPR